MGSQIYARTTRLLRVPIPSISHSITSPGLTQRSISKPTLVEYSVTGDVFPRALDGDVLASLTDVQTELKLVIELIAVLRPADGLLVANHRRAAWFPVNRHRKSGLGDPVPLGDLEQSFHPIPIMVQQQDAVADHWRLGHGRQSADLRFIEGQPLVVRLPLADSNIMP